MDRTKGRTARAAAAVSVALIGLAGCSGGAKKPSPASSPTAAALKVGFFGALSGPDAQLGINIEEGEQLAVSEYDRAGPKYPVTVDLFDSEGDPARAAAGAAKLTRDGDLAVIGPAFAGESALADPLFERARVPDISASATDVALAQHGWRYFHRVIADDSAQGRGDADYLVRTLRDRTVGVVDDGSSYGSGLATDVADQVRADGGTVVVDSGVDPGAGDFGPTVARVAAARPSAVFYGGYYEGAARLLKELRAAGYHGVFMSGDGSDDPRFISAAGGQPGASSGAAEGAYVSCACADPTQLRAASGFVHAFRSMFHTGPGVFAAEAYDATNFVLAAISAGDTTPVAVNDYLASNSYRGITKTIRFLPDGNVAGGTTYIYKVEAGRFVQTAVSS
jgi:branched-chain amino acid transport system substrate-binding protein